MSNRRSITEQAGRSGALSPRGVSRGRPADPLRRRLTGTEPSPVLRRTLAGTTALTAAAVVSVLLASEPVLALPTGGTVTEGQAEIIYGPDSVTIRQGSDRVVIEWQGFDVAAHESVNFIQPHALAAALNRVLGGGPSQILGTVAGNGQVFISNPAGVVFGPQANVDVASIVATSVGIMNDRFMAGGELAFDVAGDPTAVVENHGSIRASGLAALVGPAARNSGAIVADVAIIGGGEGFALDYYGDGLVNFAITDPTTVRPVDADGTPVEALAANTGTIMADGGQVILTADAAAGVVDTLINLDGVVMARSIENRNGQIALVGGNEGTVMLAGTIDATGDDAGEVGGTVHVLGETVQLADGAEIDVSGQAGGGTALIGGSERGGPLAPGGHIAYAAPEAGRSGTRITVDRTATFETAGYIPTADIAYIDAGATVNADAVDVGDGGTVVVWADQETTFEGTISAQGGVNGGNGGFVETSGGNLSLGGRVDLATRLAGTSGTWLIDPTDIVVDATFIAGILPTLEQGADIVISTAGAGTDPGDISFIDPFTVDFANDPSVDTEATLTAIADSAIIQSAAITAENGVLNLDFTAATGITVDAGITTNGGDVSFRADQIAVNAAIDAGAGMLNFDAPTVDLDADLVALGGITGTATDVNVLGSAGGAEIEDAIDVAAVGATVDVAAGTYDGFTIDKADLTVSGVGETTVVQTVGTAVTIAANGAVVQDMALVGSGAFGDVGVLLNGSLSPQLTGVRIQNVDIRNMEDGIRSIGDIGDGDDASIDVAILGNSVTDRAVFEDFLDSAVDLADANRGGAVYLVQNLLIQDGADADTLATGGDALRFVGPDAVTVQGVLMTHRAGDDAIDFINSLINANILIGGDSPGEGNTLLGSDSGIHTEALIATRFTVEGNALIDGQGDAIDFDANIGNGSTIRVVGNTDILGGNDGIDFDDQILSGSTILVDGNDNIIGDNGIDVGSNDADAIIGGTFTVSNNGRIEGRVEDGIRFVNRVTAGSEVEISGNGVIVGGNDGIDTNAVVGSVFGIFRNGTIQGRTQSGVEFEGPLTQNAVVSISENTNILGATTGLELRGTIEDSVRVLIDNNGAATVSGNAYDGTALVDLADFAITGGIRGGTQDSILIGRIQDSAWVTISRNMISGGANGIGFADIASTRVTEVHNNVILDNGADGVRFRGSISGPTSVFQNFIARNGGSGIHVAEDADIGTGNLLVQVNFLPGSGFAHGNGGLAINHEGTGTADVEANWWGTTSATEVASVLRGVDLPLVVLETGDDANVPPIDFGPTLFSPFAFQNDQVATLTEPPPPPPPPPPPSVAPAPAAPAPEIPVDPESLLDEIRGPSSQLDRPGGAQFFTNELGEPFQATVFSDEFALGELAVAEGVQLAAGGVGPINLGDLQPAAGPGSAEAQAEDTCVAAYLGDFWSTTAACQ